ncbi:unnamed protein product [Porites lobata]|uniref:Uncharacterized protein n=1 Tax=Porites lobata TaxID=104759 RepID=A0ABN8N979_9CNID|nr:unnamed protein product [Porites lobata]
MSSVLTLVGQPRKFFHDAIACFAKVDAVASGYSILHDGPGFVGLGPCLREHLATGCVDTAKELVSLDDLPDLDLKHILEAEVSIIIKRTLSLDRFFAGLNCVGLGDLLRTYPVIKNVLFPSPDQVNGFRWDP